MKLTTAISTPPSPRFVIKSLVFGYYRCVGPGGHALYTNNKSKAYIFDDFREASSEAQIRGLKDISIESYE